MILIIFLLGTSFIASQEFPRIKKAEIACKVNFVKRTSLFFYRYILKNDISSSGELFSFDIDASIQNSKVIDTVGLEFANHLLRNTFRRNYSYCIGKIIPFGVSSVPNILTVGSMSLEPSEIHFSLFPSRRPGETVDSLEINSVGLPSIRKVTFSISIEDVIDQLPDLEDTTSTMTESQRDSILTSLAYTTWTVGPNVYADDISFVGILDSIKSYTERSAILKWIVVKKEDDKEKEKGREIVKELMKYLDKAREHLVKNKIKEAKKQLKEFVEKVEENYHENDKDEEKEKSEHSYLTSEAYALLKYNAEYLIQQLK